MWPNSEKRCAWTIAERYGWWVVRLASSFHTRWYHLISNSFHRHQWSRASILCAQAAYIWHWMLLPCLFLHSNTQARLGFHRRESFSISESAFYRADSIPFSPANSNETLTGTVAVTILLTIQRDHQCTQMILLCFYRMSVRHMNADLQRIRQHLRTQNITKNTNNQGAVSNRCTEVSKKTQVHCKKVRQK